MKKLILVLSLLLGIACIGQSQSVYINTVTTKVTTPTLTYLFWETYNLDDYGGPAASYFHYVVDFDQPLPHRYFVTFHATIVGSGGLQTYFTVYLEPGSISYEAQESITYREQYTNLTVSGYGPTFF